MARFTLPRAQVFTLTGKLGAGFRLRFFASGTSTPQDSYSDAALTVPHSHPVLADAEGRFPDIFLSNLPYKVVLSDEDDVQIWTSDPVQSDLAVLGDPVSLSHGGTAATSAGQARTNLGLGSAATYDVGTGPSQIPTNATAGAVPVGGIIMWSGGTNDVPPGWGLCSGATYSKVDGSGTLTSPDLRDRFVLGAGSTYAPAATGGAASVTSGASGSLSLTAAAGGDHSHGGATDGHTLTTAQIPSHSHELAGSVPLTGSGFGYSGASGVTGATISATQATGGGGSHSHGIPASGTHTHAVTGGDHSHTVATMPPWYALCYIIKL